MMWEKRLIASCVGWLCFWGPRRAATRPPLSRPTGSGSVCSHPITTMLELRRGARRCSLRCTQWPPVRDYFAETEPLLVADLENRVLPSTIPSFINGMAQKPESLVVLVSMLATAWKEDLGGGH